MTNRRGRTDLDDLQKYWYRRWRSVRPDRTVAGTDAAASSGMCRRDKMAREPCGRKRYDTLAEENFDDSIRHMPEYADAGNV